MTIRIPAEYDGRILRSYLKLTLELSTAVLSKLKNHERGILVNGQRVTVRYVLREGDVLELFDRDTVESASETVIPCELPLDILYEDDFVIALNKPPFMPTHPSHGHLTDTLGNALAFRYAAASEPFVFRPLGRLDRNTSGVVVAGKTRAASGCLGRSLIRGEVTKRYIAVLVGELPISRVTELVDAPIYRLDEPCKGGHSSIKRAVGDPEENGAVRAVTRYRVLAAGQGHSLVLCEPLTGRTHQLRVHFSHLGFPILGDDLYGLESPRLPRHGLHALSLSLPMPFSRMREDVRDAAIPFVGCDPRLGLNTPTPDGFLHTWAPLPSDLAAVVGSLFPHSPLLTHTPTLELLASLTLTGSR